MPLTAPSRPSSLSFLPRPFLATSALAHALAHALATAHIKDEFSAKVNQPTNQPTDRPTERPTNHSTNQPTNQSTNQWQEEVGDATDEQSIGKKAMMDEIFGILYATTDEVGRG